MVCLLFFYLLGGRRKGYFRLHAGNIGRRGGRWWSVERQKKIGPPARQKEGGRRDVSYGGLEEEEEEA